MKRRFAAAFLSVTLVAGAVPAHAEAGREVDQRSSLKPLFELSSPAHSSEHLSFATDEELKDKWGAATRKGHFSPLVERIYDLEVPDDLEGRMENVDPNWDKYQANESANAVLGSSLKWDAARGVQLGRALDGWIAGGVTIALLAGLIGGLTAANNAGLISLPSPADLQRMQADLRRQVEAQLPQ